MLGGQRRDKPSVGEGYKALILCKGMMQNRSCSRRKCLVVVQTEKEEWLPGRES